MYRLIAENTRGEQIDLTADAELEIISIDGMTPAAAIINSAVMGGFDGERFSSSRVDKRNIVITVQIVQNPEECRLKLYRYFQPKRRCRLYFKTESRDVYIDGYTESFDGDLFEKGQKMQISVICTQPYFLLAEKSAGDITRIRDMFEFPFSIDKEGIPFSEINTDSSTFVMNSGDVETGMIIKLTATGRVVNPEIYNLSSNESFKLKDTVMIAGDVITINTNQGFKKVILESGGVTTNILSRLDEHVDWFQIEPGNSKFQIVCDGVEHIRAEFFVSEKYQGV